MRVPLFWLHDYCDPGIPIAELEHRLDDDRHEGRGRARATAWTRSSTSSSAAC